MRPPSPDQSIVHADPTNRTSLMQAGASLAHLERDWEPPGPRDTWRDDVVDGYESYWEDVISTVAKQTDVPKIMRYFDLLELEARVYDDLIDQALTFETVSGARQANPLLATLTRLVSTSIKLANELGMTPMSRLRLGLTKLEATNAMQQLENRLNRMGMTMADGTPREISESAPEGVYTKVIEL